MAKHFIYGLVDPRNMLVRYVGETSSGFKRPRAHAQANSLDKPTPKNLWIRELQALGLAGVPGVVALLVEHGAQPHASARDRALVDRIRSSMQLASDQPD